jgi:hypothetical protein
MHRCNLNSIGFCGKAGRCRDFLAVCDSGFSRFVILLTARFAVGGDATVKEKAVAHPTYALTYRVVEKLVDSATREGVKLRRSVLRLLHRWISVWRRERTRFRRN